VITILDAGTLMMKGLGSGGCRRTHNRDQNCPTTEIATVLLRRAGDIQEFADTPMVALMVLTRRT